MKTRYDCKHYYWLQCHNPTVIGLFNKCPKCSYDIRDDVTGCTFYEEGNPPVFQSQQNEYI